MTALGGCLGWLAVASLLWLSALALIATVLHADPVYAGFAVLFGVLALALAHGIVGESCNI